MSNSKNVEAFNRLIGICTGYGETYSPGSPNLRVESMLELLNQARDAMRQVSLSKTGHESATNDREVMFEEIKQITSRILAGLKSSGVLPQTIADARAMVRKIKGRVKAEKPEAVNNAEQKTPVIRRPRVTGSDYDSVVYHFDKLIAILASESKYAPGSNALNVETLQQKASELRAANQKVVDTANALYMARSVRNALLYSSAQSIYRTAQAVKQQLKAIFGYNSDAVQAASRIVFTFKKS